MRPENRARLGPGDVVLAAHPGSGTSWIATLLVRLGIFFAAGEDELLADGGVQRSQSPRSPQRTSGWIDQPARGPEPLRGRTVPTRGGPGVSTGAQRRHLPALAARDEGEPRWREPLRVVHTRAAAVGWSPPGRVVLLVRDGRDALLSLYHHQRSFAGLDVPLADWIAGNDGAWLPPPRAWAFAVASWLGAVPAERLHVLRFEDGRERPLEVFGALLAFLGVERGREELERAIEASSYGRMRAEEERAIEHHGAVIGTGRILRRGRVGEWREVLTPPMLARFRGLPERTLARLGYPPS